MKLPWDDEDDEDDLAFLFDDPPAPTGKPLAAPSNSQTPQPYGTNVGLTYIQSLDADRLNNARQNVAKMLVLNVSVTNVELCRPITEGGGGSEGCKRARELREPAWGPLDIEVTRDPHVDGLFHYKLNADSKDKPLTKRILDKIFLGRPDPEADPIKRRRSVITKVVRKLNDPQLRAVEVVLGLAPPPRVDVLDPEEVQYAFDFLDDDDG
jgi:hypothetical protein